MSNADHNAPLSVWVRVRVRVSGRIQCQGQGKRFVCERLLISSKLKSVQSGFGQDHENIVKLILGVTCRTAISFNVKGFSVEQSLKNQNIEFPRNCRTAELGLYFLLCILILLFIRSFYELNSSAVGTSQSSSTGNIKRLNFLNKNYFRFY